MREIQIGKRKIGEGHPPYIIAEACINHEGSYELAKDMALEARKMGAACVKYQIHVLENEMLREAPQSDNFDESLWDTLERTNLSIEEHKKLKKFCEEIGIQYLCTPFSRDGADILEKEINVDFYKTGSGEFTNIPLIKYIAKKGKPMIISSGMSELYEVRETVNEVKKIGIPFVLMHCTSAYPTPPEIVNLGMIPRYKKMFDIPVGLSDHSQGIITSLGAVALGANVIEKHFTFNKNLPGPDHASSIEPDMLKELTSNAKILYLASGSERKIFPQEKQIREWAEHSVVSERYIPKGDALTLENVWVKRPGPKGDVIPSKDLENILGKTVKFDIPKDTRIKYSDLE